MAAAPALTRSSPVVVPDLFSVGLHYRGSHGRHKAIVYAGESQLCHELLGHGATIAEDYGSFALLSVSDDSLTAMGGPARAAHFIRDDMDLLPGSDAWSYQARMARLAQA
jgi:hypothetical protein